MEKQVRQNVFGNTTLTWSEPMTLDEVADLESLVAIWLLAVRRRAEAKVSEDGAAVPVCPVVPEGGKDRDTSNATPSP